MVVGAIRTGVLMGCVALLASAVLPLPAQLLSERLPTPTTGTGSALPTTPLRVGAMRNILVLQWPGTTEADFDALIEMEDALESGLGETGSVNGHDFGSGEMNIFVATDQPIEVFAMARRILSDRPTWSDIRAAFRDANGETYDVLWPPGLTEFRVK